MSKSLGNMYSVADLKEKGHEPETVHYALLSGHYRQSLNFTFSSLEAARAALGKLAKGRVALGGGDPPSYGESIARGPADLRSFAPAWEALLDDLNAPKALGALFSAVREIDPEKLAAKDKDHLWHAFWFILNAFGIRLPKAGGDEKAPQGVRELAERRQDARLSRDWATADSLREEIFQAGWTVKDLPEGYDLASK